MKLYLIGKIKAMATEVKRGEIYWVDWSPSRGSEQNGIRPALIIQNNVGNKFSPNTIVAAITTTIPKSSYPFIVTCSVEESCLAKPSAIDLASIMTISKTRLKGKCGQLSPVKISEVAAAIKNSLGLA